MLVVWQVTDIEQTIVGIVSITATNFPSHYRATLWTCDVTRINWVTPAFQRLHPRKVYYHPSTMKVSHDSYVLKLLAHIITVTLEFRSSEIRLESVTDKRAYLFIFG